MQQDSYENLSLLFSAAPYLLYKPSFKDESKGAAAKVHCSLRPEFSDGYLTKDVKGGVFLEIAPQNGKDANGNPAFAWSVPGDPDPERIVTKLGLVDLQTMLFAYKTVRDEGKEIPEFFRPKRPSEAMAKYNPVSIEMFHKFKDSSTIIGMTITERGTFLSISKGKDLRRNISISLTEEMSFRKYLEHCLWACLIVGER